MITYKSATKHSAKRWQILKTYQRTSVHTIQEPESAFVKSNP